MTILSFGAGQDSTAILYKLIIDKEFRRRYVKGNLLVVMSDTGDEHLETYQHVRIMRRLCREHAIEFYFLHRSMGFHQRTWPSLTGWMREHNGIMSKAYPKTCTDNLKIKPIYNFIDHYIASTVYKLKAVPRSRKSFIKLYNRQYGRIRVLLGIAKSEETRIGETSPLKWMDRCLEKVYPLIDLGLDRCGCQEFIKAARLPLPPPSNCQRCPFLSEMELVWLYRFRREVYEEWVLLEAAKIDKWKKSGLADELNLGVHGRRLLPEVLEAALGKYGHLSDQELHDYKMSHGHCVKSKF